MVFLARLIFGCRHGRTSWPQTSRATGKRVTTVACLECGARLLYDWKTMCRGPAVAQAVAVQPFAFRTLPAADPRSPSFGQ